MPFEFDSKEAGKKRHEQLQAIANGGYVYLKQAHAEKAPAKTINKAAHMTVVLQTAANEAAADAKAPLPSFVKQPY